MPHEEPEDCPNLPGAKRFRYKPDVSNGAEPKGAEGGGRSVGAMMDAKVVDLRARRANGGTPHLAHDTEARESRGGIPSGSGMLSRVIKAVKEHETLSKVRFDELAMCPVLEDGNPVPDELILDIRIIAETEKTQVSDALARSAVQRVALRRKFDPLIEMFEKLPAWDGVNRLDTWLIKYASATDDEVSRRCGRMWLISAVARAMDPGVFVKYVPILQGAQDLGKTKLLRTLATDRFYLPMTAKEIGTLSTKLELKGKWIAEFPDLGSLPKQEARAVKAFISDTKDNYTPKYKNEPVDVPRRCVFVVTDNPDGAGWSDDTTGAVRWWPIHCTEKCNIEALEQDREQLLAEAYAAYESGEPWHIEDENDPLIEQLRERQEELRVSHPWEDILISRLYDETECTMELCYTVLSIPIERRDKGSQMAIAKILKAPPLSFERTRDKNEPGKPRGRVWVRKRPKTGYTL